MVKSLYSDWLSAAKAKRDVIATDKDVLYRLTDSAAEPYVDFDRLARLVLGYAQELMEKDRGAVAQAKDFFKIVAGHLRSRQADVTGCAGNACPGSGSPRSGGAGA